MGVGGVMIVTFGEILLRLSPPGYQRFAQASSSKIAMFIIMVSFGADSRVKRFLSGCRIPCFFAEAGFAFHKENNGKPQL